MINDSKYTKDKKLRKVLELTKFTDVANELGVGVKTLHDIIVDNDIDIEIEGDYMYIGEESLGEIKEVLNNKNVHSNNNIILNKFCGYLLTTNKQDLENIKTLCLEIINIIDKIE